MIRLCGVSVSVLAALAACLLGCSTGDQSTGAPVSGRQHKLLSAILVDGDTSEAFVYDASGRLTEYARYWDNGTSLERHTRYLEWSGVTLSGIFHPMDTLLVYHTPGVICFVDSIASPDGNIPDTAYVCSLDSHSRIRTAIGLMDYYDGGPYEVASFTYDSAGNAVSIDGGRHANLPWYGNQECTYDTLYSAYSSVPLEMRFLNEYPVGLSNLRSAELTMEGDDSPYVRVEYEYEYDADGYPISAAQRSYLAQTDPPGSYRLHDTSRVAYVYE